MSLMTHWAKRWYATQMGQQHAWDIFCLCLTLTNQCSEEWQTLCCSMWSTKQQSLRQVGGLTSKRTCRSIWAKIFIIDYFTDFPYIFDLLGKSVRYVTTICGYIIYWFSLHIFLRNVGNISKIVWNVCSVLILLTLPTFLPHHPFRVTRNVGKISKLCNHI